MISVIVPVYNARPWLGECVASVQAQTIGDWELLLVDDGSTDTSGALCRTLAAGDSRIRVLSRSNGGPSAARNAGLDAMGGGLVAFVDADDVMHPRALEWLLADMEATGAAIACGALHRFAGRPAWGGSHGRREVLDGVEAIERCLYQRSRASVNNSPGGKLFRADLWQGLRFRQGLLYEDLDIFYQLFRRAGRVSFNSRCMYAYRRTPGSITSVFTPDRADVLEATDRLCRWAESEEPGLVAAARDRRLSAAFNMLMLALRNGGRREHGELIGRCLDVIRDTRREAVANGASRPRVRLASLLSYLCV